MKKILEEKNRYVIRFDKDDEVIAELKKFCAENAISAGYFSGIGAIKKLGLSFYDLKTKSFIDKELEKDLEIASLTGNIAKKGDETMIHHMEFLATQN
jgi:uncharacterized protein